MKESFWQDLFSDKGTGLLLGAGLFFILCNIIIFAGIDFRLTSWLFFLDMRYWSIYFSIVLWIAAIWSVLEATDFVEDYLPIVRESAILCALIVIALGLRSFFSGAGDGTQGLPFWLYIVDVLAVCGAVRSLYLLYQYWNEGEASVDLEEARWFWGWSGILLVVLGIVGISSLIPVQIEFETGVPETSSLYVACRIEMDSLIRNGHGSFAMRILGFLIFTVPIVFVCVFGKWALIVSARWFWK